MLDLKFILENVEAVKENCRNRRMDADVDRVVRLAGERKRLIAEFESIRRQQKDVSQRTRSAPPEEREALVAEGRRLKARLVECEQERDAVERALREEQARIPNMSHPDAPIGAGEEDSVEVRRSGEPTRFDFEPKDHVQIGEALDVIDFEGGSKVAGRNWYFLKNDAVLLEFALVDFALRTLIEDGFTPHVTPDAARTGILDGIGFNPRGEETQIYSLAGFDLGLIATAEITLGGLLADEILDGDSLPMKLAGVSHCFRTEAGAHGRAARGLYRVHQFTKVEMFAFTKPEESDDMLEHLVSLEERMFSELGIPYRVVDCCTGDLGGPAYRKYDLEAWMPGRVEGGDWGEITSASNCTDYQARRLNIRFRREKGAKPEFVHTLNGTAIAVSRALIVILENYQQADGSVVVPDVLRPFVGKDVIRPSC